MSRNTTVRNGRAGAVLAALAATGVLLAACGNDGAGQEAADAPQATSATSGHDHGSHDHGSGPTGDPSATPAGEIEGAQLREGQFETLDGAPEVIAEVSGTAWVAGHDDGTTLTIDVNGLKPGMQYMSHLHEKPCSTDDGGPHFKFDPEGSDKPPNEVHLMFSADDDGAVRTTVENPNPDSDGAKSVVLHLADADGTKFACADL